jgi:amylosucrase
MYRHALHQNLNRLAKINKLDVVKKDNPFYMRYIANLDAMHNLFGELYPDNDQNKKIFNDILHLLFDSYKERTPKMKARDALKAAQGDWFLSNEITGMSLYVDRFCGEIKNLGTKLNYFKDLGVNFLHLMPIFESPEGESDGGYAVSNFRKIDARFGDMKDLVALQKKMDSAGMYLMLDIVLNHTSHQHEWAQKARAGDKTYQEYYYMYPDRQMPDSFEKSMPEIFPESSPGNFTYVPECKQWVMSVFHNYQWDLNYSNPVVLKEMLVNILFFANLGVDILRIDAPAFLWKQLGTNCQNLPQAHTILRFIKLCVQVVAPGMAILGEAIVAPKEIMKYFGTDEYTAHECDFAYNATHMALQWDMLATADTRVMLAAQSEILKKPEGTSWITYTRCHDDIGLAYDDDMIEKAGYDAIEHRKFLKNFYSGAFPGTLAKGALFSFNPKTGDARISGTLASLCGLEKSIEDNDQHAVDVSIKKIILMQAHSFFLGGIPMIFYGDEVGYTNDYSYLNDAGKSYDNRWMHRPLIDWTKNKKAKQSGTIEYRVFSDTKRLIQLRASLPAIADHKNLTWINTEDKRIACCNRFIDDQSLLLLFNFSNDVVNLSGSIISQANLNQNKLFDHWTAKKIKVEDSITIQPYEFLILESKQQQAMV